MEPFSALLALCGGNSPVPGEFPAQRPVTRSFDIFFDLRLNKRLSKQSWGWWFETPSWSLWRQCNVSVQYYVLQNNFQFLLNSVYWLTVPLNSKTPYLHVLSILQYIMTNGTVKQRSVSTMTSWHWNIFRITGPCDGKSMVDFPSQMASKTELSRHCNALVNLINDVSTFNNLSKHPNTK